MLVCKYSCENNFLPHMPNLSSSNSAANNFIDTMSKIWTNEDTVILLSRKHCGKRRNCSLRANFFFFHNVFKSCQLLMRQNEYLWSKGLFQGLLIGWSVGMIFPHVISLHCFLCILFWTVNFIVHILLQVFKDNITANKTESKKCSLIKVLTALKQQRLKRSIVRTLLIRICFVSKRNLSGDLCG